MKITVINGSPRGAEGNTHFMVREFAQGAEDAGAEIETVFLIEKRIQHCRGCFACWRQTPPRCAIDDDMAGLLEKLVSSDVLVFATPLYVDNVTGLMKNFMDRLIPILDPHFEKDEGGECRHRLRDGYIQGKKLVVIANSGFPEQSQFQVLRLLFRRIARNAQADLAGEIYRGGGELFRSNSLVIRALTLGYRKLLRKAGRELVERGRISEETTAQLEKPIVSDAQYIRGANKWWDRLLRNGKRKT
jgi:multimeric flavodoxin WrbA